MCLGSARRWQYHLCITSNKNNVCNVSPFMALHSILHLNSYNGTTVSQSTFTPGQPSPPSTMSARS